MWEKLEWLKNDEDAQVLQGKIKMKLSNKRGYFSVR